MVKEVLVIILKNKRVVLKYWFTCYKCVDRRNVYAAIAKENICNTYERLNDVRAIKFVVKINI
jgi:hypothetical protein